MFSEGSRYNQKFHFFLHISKLCLWEFQRVRGSVANKQKVLWAKRAEKKWLVLSKKSEHIFGCLRFQIDPFSSSIEQLDFHFRATHIRNSTTYCFLINFCCKARLHFFFAVRKKINCIFYASGVSHFLSQLAFRRCIDTYLQLVKKLDLLAVVQFSFHMINKRRLASEGCLLHISMQVNASRGGATSLSKGVYHQIKGPIFAKLTKTSVKSALYALFLANYMRYVRALHPLSTLSRRHWTQVEWAHP